MEARAQEQAVQKAAFEFPAEFGLREFPGDRFKVLVRESYVNSAGFVVLYLGLKKTTGWMPFMKARPAQIAREVTD